MNSYDSAEFIIHWTSADIAWMLYMAHFTWLGFISIREYFYYFDFL